jgi:hypothetical protein
MAALLRRERNVDARQLPMDCPRLAGIPRWQPDPKRQGHPIDPAHLSRARRSHMSVTCHAGRSRQMQRAKRPTRPTAGGSPRAGAMVRAAWRWLRTSNRYWLTTPESPVTAGLKQRRPKPVRPVDSTTGQLARGGESSSKKEALRALLAEAARMPDLLAMRRQAMAQQLVRSL